jgi:Cu2+-exporting ATPase
VELALLIDVMLLGHWLEMRALGQASGALDALAALLPDEAERVEDGGVRSVPASELRPDDVVLVRSGSRVPADGVIIDGAAELDESMITGESRTVARHQGDRVVAGTVATDSAIRVRVEAVGERTALAGIRRLVEQAQASRSRAQALADRAAAMLFWFALGAGVITLLVWLALGNPDQAIERTVTVLVIACPGKMLQNLAWATGYNAVAVPLAAGVLAWAGISLAPALGAVLMSLSTIVVALNAQLLRRVDLRPVSSQR